MERHTPISPAKPEPAKQRRNGATTRKRTATQLQRNDSQLAVAPTSSEPSISHPLIEITEKSFQQRFAEHAVYRAEHPEIETSRNGTRSVLDSFLTFLTESFRYDPHGFYQEICPGKPLRQWQATELKRIRNALQENPERLRYALATGKGAGKTELLSILYVWHVVCHQNSKTLLMSNTGRQTDEVPWDRIAQLVCNSKLDDYFKVISNKIICKQNENWCGITLRIQPNRYESLGGHHAQFVAVFIDEASGILDDKVFHALEDGLTDEHGYMFLFGNPTRPLGFFRHTFPGGKYAENWLTRKIDTRTVPEVNSRYLQYLLEKYDNNEEHPLYRMFVKGEFPLTDKHQFFDEEMLRIAKEREGICLDTHPVVIGIDPGMGRIAKTAICVRQGGKIHHMESFIAKYEESASRCYEIYKKYADKKPYIIVEGGAIGEGFLVAFKPYFPHDVSRIITFLPQSKNMPQETFHICENARSSMYYLLQQALLKFLHLDNPIIEGQLLEMLFYPNTENKFVLESKISMSERGFDSPDEADALAFTFIKAFDPVIKRTSTYDLNVNAQREWYSNKHGWRNKFVG